MKTEITITPEGVKAIHYGDEPNLVHAECFPPSVGEQLLTLLASEAVQAVRIAELPMQVVARRVVDLSPEVAIPFPAADSPGPITHVYGNTVKAYTADGDLLMEARGEKPRPFAPFSDEEETVIEPHYAPRGRIPVDFPWRDLLDAGGVRTFKQLEKRITTGTLTELDGIGDARADEIVKAYDALWRVPEMTATPEETARLDKVNKALKEKL